MVGFFTGIKKLAKLLRHIVIAGIVLLHSVLSLPRLPVSGGSEQNSEMILTWHKQSSYLVLVAV